MGKYGQGADRRQESKGTGRPVQDRLRPGQRVLLESAVAPGVIEEAVIDRIRPQREAAA